MKITLALLFGLSLTASLRAQAQETPPAQPTGPAVPQVTPDPGTAIGSDATAVEAEMQSVASELQTLSQKIEDVQQQAREDEDVEEALLEYGKVLRDEMVKIAPDQAEQIERKTELLEEIVTTSAASLEAGDQEDFGATLQEHQRLRQELAEIESHAAQTEPVQAKERIAREVHIAKMQQLEPNLMVLVQQANELSVRLQQLRSQLQTTGR